VCPGKKRKAEIDSGGIECIHGLVEIQPQVLVGIERTGQLDQCLGEVGIDAPVSLFVGLGQGAPGNRGSNPHMIELGLLSTKTGFDVAKTFAIGQLRKRHDQVLIEAPELLHIAFALITLNIPAKGVQG